MSKTSKTILGIVILVIVLALAIIFWRREQAQAPTGAEEVTELPTGSETTDEALDEDLSSIDAQLQGVADDNANVSASVDQVGAQ